MRPCPARVRPPIAVPDGALRVDVETGVLSMWTPDWWVVWRPAEMPDEVVAWLTVQEVQRG